MNDFNTHPKVKGIIKRIEESESLNEDVLDKWDDPNPIKTETKIKGRRFIAGASIGNFTLINRADSNESLIDSVWFVRCAVCNEISKDSCNKIINTDGKCAYCRKRNMTPSLKQTPCVECGISINAGDGRRKLCLLCENKRKTGYQVSSRKSSFRGKVISMLRTAKGRSKAKGLDFDLDVDYVIERLELNGYRCEKSGVPLDQSPSEDHEFSVCSKTSLSLDRKDPSKGYTKANTQLVSYHYNVAKNVFSEDDLIRLCKGILDVHESGRRQSQN